MIEIICIMVKDVCSELRPTEPKAINQKQITYAPSNQLQKEYSGGSDQALFKLQACSNYSFLQHI